MAKDKKIVKGSDTFGFVYFLSIIGAIVYFVQNSEGFWGFIWAVIKGFIWPAFATHEILGLLNL